MKNKFTIILLVNCLLVALAVGVYAMGYKYDKANSLFPEADNPSSDFVVDVYGKRWRRTSDAILFFGVILDAVLAMMWFRSTNDKI
ncbi:MAG: hypothetical protein ABI878_04570 [Acidobacteriota bacterium]